MDDERTIAKAVGVSLTVVFVVVLVLTPRLLAVLKKLDEEIEPSAEQVEAIQHSGSF
jgi:hypothetical protein